MNRPRYNAPSTLARLAVLLAAVGAVRAGDKPADADPVFEVLQVDGRTRS
jgi:hypothetical protein